MTPASLMNGIEAAAQEAQDGIGHAAADPKGTFNRALDRIKHGIEDTAQRVKQGVETRPAWPSGLRVSWSAA